MFPHEQAAASSPPKASWCSFSTDVSPPRDVFRCQIHVLSFIFICCCYGAVSRYWWALFVLCSHFWGTSRVVWPPEMCEWRVQIIHYAHYFLKIHLFLLLPPPFHLCCVNVSTFTRFPGHSQALKVNASFTSRRIWSSIIKAVRRAICIILGIRGSPGSSSAGHAEWTALMKFEEVQTAAAQQDASDTGELRQTAVLLLF